MPQTQTKSAKRRRIVWFIDFDKTITLNHTGDQSGLFKYRHSKHYNNLDEIRSNIKFLEDFKKFVEQKTQDGDIFIIASFTTEERFYGDYFKDSYCYMIPPEYYAFLKANPNLGITGKELISKYADVVFGANKNQFKDYRIQAFQPPSVVRTTQGKQLHITNALQALKKEGIDFDEIMVVDDDGNNCRIAEENGQGAYCVDPHNIKDSFWPALELQPEICLFKRYAKIFSTSQKFQSAEDEHEFKELWTKYENALENNAIKDPYQLRNIIYSLMWCLSPLKDDPAYTKKYRDIMVRAAAYNDSVICYEMAKFHAEGKYGFNGAEQACDYMKIVVERGSPELSGLAIQYLRDKNLFAMFNNKYPQVITGLIEPELVKFVNYTHNYYQGGNINESEFRQLWEKLELALENKEITNSVQYKGIICALAKCYSRHKDDEKLQGKFVTFLNMAEPYRDPQLCFDMATYHYEKKYGYNDIDKACEYINFVLNNRGFSFDLAARYLSNHRELYAIVVEKYPNLKKHHHLVLLVRPSVKNRLEYMQWILTVCNNPEIFIMSIQTILKEDIQILDAKSQKEFIRKIINALKPIPEEHAITDVKDSAVNRCIEMMKIAESNYLSLNQEGAAEIFAKIMSIGVTLNEHFIFIDFFNVTPGSLDECSSLFLRYLKEQIKFYVNLDNEDEPKLIDLVRKKLFIHLYCNYTLNPADKTNIAIYNRLHNDIVEIYDELRYQSKRTNEEEKLFQMLNEQITVKRKILEEVNKPSIEQSATCQLVGRMG